MSPKLGSIAFGLLIPLSFGTQAVEPERFIFVTSVAGSGDLGSWPDGVPEVGLAAGDRICRERAVAGGLANPDDYIAWLSDADDDAYCRVHGATGKRDSNCNGLTLPARAGPWRRLDGQIALNVSDIAFASILPPNAMLRPIVFNEFGQTTEDQRLPFTGSLPNGKVNSEFCASWKSASAAEYGKTGASHGLDRAWTDWGSSPCSFVRPLICMSRGIGVFDVEPLVPDSSRFAFVSSSQGTGDLGSWPTAEGRTGLDAGDHICRGLALDAGFRFSSSYRAWLSAQGRDAAARFANDGPWIRPDGVKVADSLADLVDGSLDTAIVLNEFGYVDVGFNVWTGTGESGHSAANQCDGWESASGSATAGVNMLSDGQWTERNDSAGPTVACANPSRIYCFADHSMTVFRSGFEEA